MDAPLYVYRPSVVCVFVAAISISVPPVAMVGRGQIHLVKQLVMCPAWPTCSLRVIHYATRRGAALDVSRQRAYVLLKIRKAQIIIRKSSVVTSAHPSYLRSRVLVP